MSAIGMNVNIFINLQKNNDVFPSLHYVQPLDSQ
jgi:hypothetical protein